MKNLPIVCISTQRREGEVVEEVELTVDRSLGCKRRFFSFSDHFSDMFDVLSVFLSKFSGVFSLVLLFYK